MRYRDSQKLQVMRVDEVANMLKKEHPDPSTAYNNFYAKAFDPAKFFGEEESKVAPGAGGGAPLQAAAAAAQQASYPAVDEAERARNAKFDEIEQKLSRGVQWLSGGNAPGAADAEAIQAVRGPLPPVARVHPHAYAWYAFISKFTPEKLAAMK